MGYEARNITDARSDGRTLVVSCRLRDCHAETSRWPLLEVYLGSRGFRQRSMHGVLGVLHLFLCIC